MMTFVIFFVFSMTMISFGFFMSTLLHQQAKANQSAFSFVLITIIFELVFSQPDYNNRFFFSDS
jgi:ABC-type multidrug transport system permease subunit